MTIPLAAASRSEASNDGDSDFIDGADVFAVKQDDVEAGRKGQRGQNAQHMAIVSPRDLRCAC